MNTNLPCGNWTELNFFSAPVSQPTLLQTPTEFELVILLCWHVRENKWVFFQVFYEFWAFSINEIQSCDFTPLPNIADTQPLS